VRLESRDVNQVGFGTVCRGRDGEGVVKGSDRQDVGGGGAGNWEAGRLGGWGAASGRVRVRVPARAQEGLAWLDLETGQKRGGQVKRATAETSPISLWVVLLTSRRRAKCHPDKGELHEDTSVLR
jgi:hypothetical protein